MNDVSDRRKAARPNGRVLVAAVTLIAGLVFYAGLVANVVDMLPDHGLVQGLFIGAAGLAWVWPAIRLVRWASVR